MGDATSSPSELLSAVKAQEQSAVAITDHGTTAGLWDALKASKKAGVKLIAGCECYFVDDASQNEDTTLRHLILIAKNAAGYRNLLTINKIGYDHFTVNFKKSIPRIDWKMLEEYSEGLICTTACGNGIIGQYIMQDNFNKAVETTKHLKDIFGDNLALELQPHNLQRRISAYSGAINQQKVNMAMKKLSEDLGIKAIVATNSHYITKEHNEDHDAYLCISSGQPITSGSRLKYDKPEFYVKSSDEIYKHFERHLPLWGESFVESLFENSVYFADMCEHAEWVDPAVLTGDKHQLPEFPIKDEADYTQFQVWQQSPSVFANTKVKEDAQFYRYRSEKGLADKIAEEKIPASDNDECVTQMLEEFDVLEYRDFPSYMLITADFIKWCNRKGIPVGPGRGCLHGSVPVLTGNGFKRLDEIKVGDCVYTHSGSLKPVTNRFEYSVQETGLKIDTEYSFNEINLTKDHKVFASKSTETERYIEYKKNHPNSAGKIQRWNAPSSPSWIPASELCENDLIFMPWISNRTTNIHGDIDLARFADEQDLITKDAITFTVPNENAISIRCIAALTGLSRGAVQNVKRKGKSKPSTIDTIGKYLDKYSIPLDKWVETDNTHSYSIHRYIKSDSDLYYFLGRWVGDGWTMRHSSGAYITGVAFNSKDVSGIDRIVKYFTTLGFNPDIKKAKNKKLVQVIIRSKLFYNFLVMLFPEYKQSSDTKHLPSFFRTLPDDHLSEMVRGLFHSDGSLESCIDYTRESFDSTSQRLVLEVKEALLYLKIPSSINTREPFKRGKYTCSRSYKLRCHGVDTKNSTNNLINKSGYFCRIRSIEEVVLDRVYDISVDVDTSYLTSNYAVHNSVGGSLTAYVNEIHHAYPKRYGLIFARFLNKYKEAFPDIDNDIAPSGRDKLHAYLRSKYGQDNVAHVSNINTITPKVYARDIARVFEFGGEGKTKAAEIGNAIADSIPNEMKTVKQALEEAPLFAEYAKQYPQLARFAEVLGGKPRAWATHAGGIVICKRPLTGLVPVRRDTSGALVLEYDKERAEENGLVKIDTLGLETLDTIGETYNLIKANGKEIPEKIDYEMNDPDAYKLVGEGDTFGVFQLGGTAVHVCKKVEPKNVADLALISSLVRPAAKDTIPDLLKVRNGEAEVELPHPSLNRAFGDTYGFGLFEESLMYAAGDVAGWDLHDADKLRKMTKMKGKEPEKVKKWKEEFIEGSMKKHGFDREFAEELWSKYIESFGGYGFNRSLYFSQTIDIYTNEGKLTTTKPIKDIMPGEFVRSRDEITGNDIFVEVIALHDHGELEVVEVELDDGRKVTCTMNHKFRVKENGEMLPLWQILKEGLTIVVTTVE
jgi:intein/homing endonuclease